MADVYEISIGTPSQTSGTGRSVGVNVYTKIELVDASGDNDEWHTDNDRLEGTGTIGEGGGVWLRRASLNQIVLMNQDATAVDAQLQYSTWPLRSGHSGRVTLTRPLRNCPSAGSSRELSYVVMEVK